MGFYGPEWREISWRIRFLRAGGLCERCRRPDGVTVLQLADGVWSRDGGRWFDDAGLPSPIFDLLAAEGAAKKRVRLAAAHLNHDPRVSEDWNLAALCGRCHLRHDRHEHIRRRRFYRLAARAIGDLFEGRYPVLPLPDMPDFAA
jgi:5-methylcytosine-specific restriction endonuclease McrA